MNLKSFFLLLCLTLLLTGYRSEATEHQNLEFNNGRFRPVVTMSPGNILQSALEYATYANEYGQEGWFFSQDNDLTDSVGGSFHPVSKLKFDGTIEGLHNVAAQVNNITISEACALDILTFYTALSRQNTSSMWALKIVDAAGKPGSDIFAGALTWAGSYDECIALNQEEEQIRNFEVHYCLTELGQAPLQLPSGFAVISTAFHEGLCMPRSCGEADVDTVVAMAMQRLNLTGLPAPNTVCQPLTATLDSKAKIMAVVCFAFLVAMITGTVLDLAIFRHHAKPQKMGNDSAMNGSVDHESIFKYHANITKAPVYRAEDAHYIARIFLAFSVYSNMAKLLSTESRGGQLSCLNGIRFFSMAWVVLGHTYVFGVLVFANILDSLTMITGFKEQVISNALVSVDSFFTLSGFLVAYVTVKYLIERGDQGFGKGFWPNFYFHRFWRLTPPYMLILGVYVSLFIYTGSGPWWPVGNPELNGCKDSWWTNILYVNNLVKDQELCMSWTWYMANDMQFYVVSPIFLYLFYKQKKAGIIAVLAALVAHIVVTGVLSHHYDLPVNQFGANLTDEANSADNFSAHYYFKPYTRIGPYLVGILLGFLIGSKPEIHVKKVYVAVGWTLSTGIALAILYGVYPNYNGSPFSNNLSSAYNALHRTAWGCCVCWVIFACAYGYGGPVNKFLSHKIFMPLGRLSYCAYLIHPIVIFYRYSRLTTPLHFDHFTMLYMFFGHLIIAFGLALIASLAFEAPMMQLEKVFLRPSKKSEG